MKRWNTYFIGKKKRLGFKGKYNNTKTFMDTRRENQPYEMSHSTPEP